MAHRAGWYVPRREAEGWIVYHLTEQRPLLGFYDTRELAQKMANQLMRKPTRARVKRGPGTKGLWEHTPKLNGPTTP